MLYDCQHSPPSPPSPPRPTTPPSPPMQSNTSSLADSTLPTGSNGDPQGSGQAVTDGAEGALVAWQLALIIVGVVSLLFIVALFLWCRCKKKRGNATAEPMFEDIRELEAGAAQSSADPSSPQHKGLVARASKGVPGGLPPVPPVNAHAPGTPSPREYGDAYTPRVQQPAAAVTDEPRPYDAMLSPSHAAGSVSSPGAANSGSDPTQSCTDPSGDKSTLAGSQAASGEANQSSANMKTNPPLGDHEDPM